MLMQDLPPEILQNIFSKLSPKEFTSNVRLVCRRWYKLAQLERIALNLPNNDKFKELLTDLGKNISFASSTKELELINYYCLHGSYGGWQSNTLSQPVLYGKHLFTVVGHCSNLLSLKLRISCIQEISDYLDQIQEAALDNKLKLQDLLLDIPDGYGQERRPAEQVETALNQLFTCLNPQLRSFIASSGDLLQDEEGYIHSDIDYAIVKRRSINFVYQDIGNNDNIVLLEELVIVGCYYTISRECLKYIISGKLPHLKVLKLDLNLLGIIDERDESIWNQLKDYCKSSSIEKCKIIIRNIFEDEILTLVLYNNEDAI